jgi:multiple sugar transport system substrate-binding protein
MRYTRASRLQKPLAALSAVLLVAACSGTATPAPAASQAAPAASQASLSGTTITVAVSSSPSATALRALGAEFATQTGATVQFVDLPNADITAKLLLASKQSTGGYDIMQFDSPSLAPLVAGGALADLTERVKEPAYDITDFSAQVQEYAQINGKTYSLPLSSEPYILWYRTDKLSAAGLKPPTTWDEYFSNAKTLGMGGNDQGYSPEFGAYYWLEDVYLYGGQLFDPATCTPALDSPQARAATAMYASLIPFTPASVINGGGNEMTTSLIQGDSYQEINATGYYSIMNDPKQSKIVGNFAAAMPPLATANAKTLLFGWLIGLSANSKNQDAAWQFLTYALGKANKAHLISLGAPPPARLSLLDDQQATAALPYLPVLIAGSKNGIHLPYIPQMPQIISQLSAELNKMGTGQQTADQLTTAANAAVGKILADAGGCK